MPAFVRIVDRQKFASHFAAKGVAAEVASRAGISRPRMSQLINGSSQVVPIRTGIDIEKALGVPVGTLFQPDDAELLTRYLTTGNEALALSPSS